jgi:peptide/nickel transport system substrate-binding protein
MVRVGRPRRTRTALVLAGAVGVTAVAACSTTSSIQPTGLGGAFGTIPAAAAGAQHSGTITWAEGPNSGPTWILPVVTSAAYATNDVNEFEWEMWRPLYWFAYGAQPVEMPAMSLAYDPKWSNGDRTATVTLKSTYKWSDGQPISSQDVLLCVMGLIAIVIWIASSWAAESGLNRLALLHLSGQPCCEEMSRCLRRK